MGSACSVSAWPNRARRVKQAFTKMKMLCKSFHSNCVTNMYINKRRTYVHLLLTARTGKGQRVKSIPKALIFKNNKVNWEVQPVWGCTSLYTAVSKISNITDHRRVSGVFYTGRRRQSELLSWHGTLAFFSRRDQKHSQNETQQTELWLPPSLRFWR